MRFFLSVWMAVFLLACAGDGKKTAVADNENVLKDTANFTSLQWTDSTYKNFGKIAEGQKLEVSYSFRNTGTKPLVIARVQPSCGCTVAEQPSEPILPGGRGVIKAVFNSENHVGINRKVLYVYANTRGTQSHELHFSVIVEKQKW